MIFIPGKKFIKSPNWSLFKQDLMLIVNGGADNLFAIENKTEKDIDKLLDLYNSGNFDGIQGSSEGVKEIFNELLLSGVIHKDQGFNKKIKIGINWVGDANESLLEKIKEELSNLDILFSDSPDISIFIRTNGELKKVLDTYPIKSPHLLVDLSMHHTISFGPLVIFGETSCFGCLFGRIGSYWGDVKPPSKSAIQSENLSLVSSLIIMEIQKVNKGDYSLINNTMAYDFFIRKVHQNSLYKLPWCEFCSEKDKGSSIGSIKLPWTLR